MDEKETEFEHECMRYLRNLSGKFHGLLKTVNRIKDGMETLQSSVLALGNANSQAYKQVQVVVNHLTEKTDEVVQDLSSAMGTLRASAFDPDDFADINIYKV